MKQVKLIGLCLMYLVFIQPVFSQENTMETTQINQMDLVLGFGFIISPDYNDVLKSLYSSYSFWGGWGWLDFQFGTRFNTSEKFSITPSIDLLFNFVSLPSSTFTNTIILPSAMVRYAFTAAPSIYISGEINYSFANTGGRIHTESSGVGFGGAIGYAGRRMDFKLGYLYIPVEVNSMGDKNFGGIILKYNYFF